MACVYRIKGNPTIFNSIDELHTYLKENRNTGVKFNGVVAEEKTENGRPVYAWYDPATKSISISQRWVNKYKEDASGATLLLVHEILHALKGTRTTEQQTELINKLKSLW